MSDTHFFSRFGSAMLLSVVGGLGAIASGGASVVIGGAGQSAASTALQQDGQRSPTIRVPPGEPIRVYTARDLDSARSLTKLSMTADIHPLPSNAGDDAEAADPGSLAAITGERSVYLDAYLAPFKRWLDRDTVTEIMVNRPGEVWVEDASNPGMQRVDTPEIDDRLVQRLAEQVARVSHQGINREHRCWARLCPTVRACSSAALPPAASTG